MSVSDLDQLESLARVDELLGRVHRWAETETPWEPVHYCRALLGRLRGRLETVRTRLAAPLVAATFGGTGTGKSTLVNALVGRDCTESGRERPTTTKPILIAHPDTDIQQLGLPLDELRLVQVPAAILRDMVILDCPDPDTTEAETQGSNLARLHKLLPYCDVLLYVSTQQKYRSGRVIDELAQAASGCRLVFVQTNADLDSDVREDWRKHLAGRYEVPDMFFIDSVRAFREQQSGETLHPEFQRLVHLLTTQLSASRRMHVRQANLLELLHEALERCRAHLGERLTKLAKVEAVLEEQRQKLVQRMSETLRQELMSSGHLWERRLCGAVAEYWGVSPFSAVLRFYNGFGSWLASMGLFRARTTAQMALIGAVQGARWLTSKQQEADAESRLQRVGAFGLDDAHLRESQVVLDGYAREAQFDAKLLDPGNLDRLRHQAVRVEGEFLGDAGRHIDEIIDQLAIRHSGPITRWTFEILLGVLIVYLFGRSAHNFFYDSQFNSRPLFGSEYYVHALVFLTLWSGLLVMLLVWRLRQGLHGRIAALARQMADRRLSSGLFPELEHACRDARLQVEELHALSLSAQQTRDLVTAVAPLGGAIVERRPAVAAG